MKVKTAYSQKNSVSEICSDIKQQIGTFDAKLVQFFTSSHISPETISAEMQNIFAGIPIIGCSTAGEIISGKMLSNSVVLMAFGADIVSDCKIEILTNLSTDNQVVDKAFANFENYFGISMANLNSDEYVGMVLFDGLCGKEEIINERIGDLTNVTFIGGSAGDDLQFKQTYLYVNGKTYTDAAVLVLIKSNTHFEVLKTQSFIPTQRKALITKANEAKRTIIEINNQPATEEYSKLVGMPVERISESFQQNPLGIVFEDHIFVRSPQKTDGNNIVFYCAIREGMELDVLKSTEIVADTQNELNLKIEKMGGISAIVNYNCILRTLELQQNHETEAYGEIFKNIPTIGFSTYGESYIGHINQTATMLCFK